MPVWIDKATDAYCKLLELLLVGLLTVMVVMVFGNVVLRYAFNSGITVSEELSRWAFVWMTFLGAVVAIRENGHLGTDLLVGRLGPAGKKICLAIAETLMFGCTVLLFSGALTQARLSAGMEAPVSGWSMAWLPVAGLVFAVSAGVFHLLKLGALLTGKLSDDQLVTVQESEDLAALQHARQADEGKQP